MINIDVEKEILRDIEQRLGGLSKKTPDVLKRAVNDTAKWAKKELAVEAKKAYAIKQSKKSEVNKTIKLKRATVSNPTAMIKATGEAQEIIDFKAMPNAYSKEAQLKVARGKVLKSSNMKPLQKGRFKAFIMKFGNDHESIVQRVEKGEVPTRSKLGSRYVKKLLSPSIPTMLGSERVYNQVEIQGRLKEELNKHIERVLKK